LILVAAIVHPVSENGPVIEATFGIVVITVHVPEALDTVDKFPAASCAVPAFTAMPSVPSPLVPLVTATIGVVVVPPL
jgi:hypothetical protein